MTFSLLNPDSEKDSAIYFRMNCADGRLKYYTGEKANKNTWENRTASNRGTRAQLARITATVEEMTVDFKIKGQPLTKAAVISSLNKVLHKKTYKQIDLFESMDKVIDKMESGQILTPDKKRYAKGSIKTFRFTVGFLKSFDPTMKMQDITIETYYRFIRYCQAQDYSTNYIGSQIKNWKALGKAVGGNPIFDNPEFKKITEDSFDIYLNEEELKCIYELHLSNPRYGLVRDWFILDCYTGLRVSDLIILSKHNYSKGFISIANMKTSEKVVIPQHPYVKSIMDKYRGFPPAVTDVEINRIIKLVAQEAGITSKVLFTITKGGKRNDHYLEKWEMCSCHTARRSFITNLLKNGVPDTIVMKLTGIKSHLTLKKYDKLGAEEAAVIAASHSFFKPAKVVQMG